MRGVDPAVIERQAFGGQFDKTSDDPELAAWVMAGKLEMKPHPPFTLAEQLTWAEDPFGQRNWVAQLHMLRWLDPVRRVALDGDEAARAFWLRHVRSWVEGNPVGGGQSRFAWSDMVAGIRALELTLGFPLAPATDSDWLLRSIETHGEWLADPEQQGRANHALHQHQGLFVIGSALHRADWRDLAVERLNDLIEVSYDDQGMNDEGAIAYHRDNLIWWNLALRRLELEEIVRPPAAKRLELAALALTHAARPDGTLELIGDTETNQLLDVDSPEVSYVRTAGSEGLPPRDKTVVYNRGYVFGRSGWGEFERDFDQESFYSVSFGPANRVHGHADGGSLTFFANQRPWLVDAGKYSYNSDDPMRAFVISRAAHNVVTIPKRRYDRASTVLLTAHVSTEELDDFTFEDAGYSGVVLTRRVVYSRGGEFLVVVDTVAADSPVAAEQLWHLSPEVNARRDGRGYHLSTGRGSARMLWAGSVPSLRTVKGSEEPFQGWVSPSWGVKEASEVIVARREGKRFRFITILGAPAKGDLSVGRVESGDFGIRLNVSSGSASFHVHLHRDGSTIQLGHPSESSATPIGVLPLARVAARVATLGNRLAEPVPGRDDHLAVWARAVAHTNGGHRDVRLDVAHTLLERLDAMPTATDCDFGIRAAVIDILGADLMGELGIRPQHLGANRSPLLRWGGSDRLVHSRSGLPIRPADTAVALPAAAFHDAQILVHEEDGLVMPFAVRNGTSDVLLVRFHGALVRAKTELPLFQWLTTDLAAEHAFAIFQDPTLDLDRSMNLAWFLGTRGFNVHDRLAEIIRSLAAAMGKKRILLVGPSGGGYVAMQVASRLPDTHALVFNPQVELTSYHPPSMDKALWAGLQLSGDDPVPDEYADRVSLLRRLRLHGLKSRVTYVQNSGDGHHVKRHAEPLRELLASDEHLRHKFEFVDVSWGPGHVRPTVNDYATHIRQALDT